MSSRSPSPSSSPHTPPPASPRVRVTLPTPPSFSAHRSRSSEGMERRHSSNSITSAAVFSENEEVDQGQTDPKQAKRLSISSIHDPVVEGNDKRTRRVSFSNETKIISRPISLVPASGNATVTEDGGLKSPVYKIPQRQNPNPAFGLDNDGEETLTSPQTSGKVHSTPSSSSRRPLSFQGLGSPSSASPSRFASTAAARGISIAPSLSKGGAFRSIWSAGIVPSSSSGWISPAPALASATARPPGSAKTPTTANSIRSPTVGSAAEVAKHRGLSIAVLKEDGQGVIPITPGLGSSTPGLKSPLGGLKSPEVKVLRGLDSAALAGSNSAKSTGVPDTAGSGSSKKEIILCKFYHTPGLTCTSRPCRFVHNLSSIGIAPSTGVPSSALLSTSTLLSPRQTPDPTSGTFAQAQMRAPAASGKSLRLRVGENLENVLPGERVVVEDENGEEIVGQVFLMSGGGKGAMGKSREKWKTVPCKDFAEGHCPYGDYCSFIHDEKLPNGILGEDGKPGDADKPTDTKTDPIDPRRLGHRKSASLGSSLNAWAKALPRVQLVPSVKVDPEVLKKRDNTLSAFAPPFSKQPVTVDNAGEIVPALPSPKPLLPSAKNGGDSIKAVTPPARAKEPLAIPMAPTPTAPPKSNAWSKGPPPSLRKVASLKKVTIAETEPSSQLATILDHSSTSGELKTPTSASHLMPPVSAFSMFGTESDPASPFDPVVQRRKMQELEDALAARQIALPKSNLSQAMSFDVPHMSPTCGYPTSPPPSVGFNSSTYPWGMPMSPVVMPGYQDPTIPRIPGGLGVMWTPAGWAVQDAAMKSALRTAEVKTKFGEETRRRQAKNYFRTRPCKFFLEGFCPHGDECTYMHMVPPPSPDQTASSDSGSFSPPSKPSNLTLASGPRHPKHQTLPCKFFNSAMGCMNGDACTFLHTRVVPDSVPIVERPRPWRTKPCRHFQLGRCTLGDACHFAHVPDPAWLASGGIAAFGGVKGDRPCAAWNRTGRCPDGTACRFLHVGEGGEGNVENLTEEGLQKTLEEMREKVRRWNEEDDEEDDDVEIVTGMSSSSYSPSSSIRA
ncbi:hypothetical protein I316_03682 [Kwoniella heveanensis BCC8398]|uniref:C3H1-type domain-containing protein n=1 Tax=Kwoniella heveanensis BCC8398 TaxID=1296120 RepID=A0A1B9GUB3_9TREE|nr:hypothetical protein I316_03682 [Kwoniella heveanensis BCC8398]